MAAVPSTESQLRLNLRQRKFVDHYAIHRNATKAAIVAGYSAKTAGSIGSRLLKDVRISTALRTILASVDETIDKTTALAKQELLQYWSDMVRLPVDPQRVTPADQLRASEYLGRAHRMFHDEGPGATAFAISIHLGDSDERDAVTITPSRDESENHNG